MTTVILTALVAGTVVVAVFLRPRVSAGGRLPGPLASLTVVTVLVYLNQVLFTVYVLRVHGGDVSFVAQYLPDGWFALDRGPLLRGLAEWFPVPGLLAPTVLRVQAFLELPFVVFAYLTVCRWYSPTAYRAALGLVPYAAASYTAVFCLIEWTLWSPYTAGDIAVRVAAGLVVPVWARFVRADTPEPSTGPLRLLTFAVSTAALGVLVLVVYDTALLYNLGHLRGWLPYLAAALAALVGGRLAARHLPVRDPGVGVDTVARAFGWFLVVFFVPALPVRYGLGFGARYAAAGAGLLLVGVAAWRGAREVLVRIRRDGDRRLVAGWVGRLAGGALAGCAAATVAAALPAAGFPEVRLLQVAAAFFGCAVATCALVDHLARSAGSE